MTARFKVVLTDHRFPDVEPMRAALAEVGAEMIDAKLTTPEAVAEAVRDADAVLNVRTLVTPAAIDGMTRCKIIVRLGIGVDSVDVDAATRRGIPVSNVPDYCIDEVADHALTLLLGYARRLTGFLAEARKGVWSPGQMDVTAPPRLRGQVLGLVGLGRIGRAVAQRARAFGLEVIVYDPYLTPEAVAQDGLRLVPLAELLATADYVSLHCALTAETRGLLNAAAFARMKKSAFLINVARGPIVDQAALAAALGAGTIAGAALDVLDSEPPAADDPILTAPHLMLTSHVAWYSKGSMAELPVLGAREAARVLAGEAPRYAVNARAIAAR